MRGLSAPAFLLLWLLLLAGGPVPGPFLQPAAAQSPSIRTQALAGVTARLETEIRRSMLEGQIPSMTIALTDRSGELWAGAFGESNLWAGTPASTHTVYLIGSTFKVQSTVALLQQWEAGKFRLDDRVNDYLAEFQIRGEDPADPVTFRHLLTHASGLPAAFGPHLVWGETVPPPLARYLADSLEVTAKPLEERLMAGGWGYEAPGYGLTWWVTTREGESFFGHSGSVSGYTAFVMGNRTRGFGVALLTNGNRAHPQLVRLSNLALDLLIEELGESR